MITLSYNIVMSAMHHTSFWVAALLLGSLNMLVQICFDMVFGYKDNTKIRGWRGE